MILYMDWHIKHKTSIATFPIDAFSMSFIIAVSDRHLCGIIGNKSTNSSDVFIHFLSWLIDWLVNLHSKSLDNIAFLMDNASFHKTQAVSKYSINSKIHLISIPSYSPWLNHAETFIRAIKARSKQKWRNGR